ncbi:class A beta-lactamase-related serine hydrolase [Sphingobacterium puteale]|uniref:Class A beta-lactamase-related serine hydrolase n=2 Tax=Sphingobacterium puteale TaxID=2420510 RepID=A0A420VPS8_9SPHI|nr:class A beta-lactamase-related serine hydrolase [Sphingobacterium puteale]
MDIIKTHKNLIKNQLKIWQAYCHLSCNTSPNKNEYSYPTILKTKMKYLIIIFLTVVLHHSLIAQEASLKSFIQSYATKNSFDGTILIQQDTAIIYHESFGIADRRFNLPINKETIYNIASITKAFTAVLILQLVEQGKLDLNKPFKTYLPEYPDQVSQKVTTNQLLNHSSGIVLIDTVSSVENAMKYGLGIFQTPRNSDQMLKSFWDKPLVNEPGTKFNYNNADYIILGKIIEKIYGKTYEEVLSEKILKPLGTRCSGLAQEKDIIKNLASTYFRDNNSTVFINNIPMFIENWYAAGAMYSSPEDLLKFSNALFGLKLIRKKSLDLMLTPGLDNYGFGVWVNGQGNDRRMERYGQIMGINAVWMKFLNRPITIIILSNTNVANLGELALGIEGKILK